MQQYLKTTQKGALTSDDYDILGITQDKTRTKNPVPTDVLALVAVKQQHALLRIEISVPELPDLNHRSILDGGKNNGVHLYIAYATDESPDAPPEEDFLFYHVYNSSVFDVTFPSTQIGHTVYLMGRLVNTMNEIGPIGQVAKYVVPN